MHSFLTNFLLCFIPLFVAVDPLGLVPVFIGITARCDRPTRRRLALQALPTALAIGVGFFTLGGWLLQSIGIQVADLQIAGGALLFVYAMMDLFMPGKPSVQEERSLGIVPLATPLIVGPAVLTLGLVLVNKYHAPGAAVLALVANLAIVAGLLLAVDRVIRYMPVNAMSAISKVIDLLMAAIGVSFVREGVLAILHGGLP